MRRAALLALAFQFCLSAHAGTVSPIWEGQMTQVDAQGTQTYPVRLMRLGDSISSEYPTLKCRGNWKLIASHIDYKVYEERIISGRLTKGADRGCIDGIVTFRDGWKEAQFGWFASFEGQPSSASAIVRPVSK